MSLPKVVQMNSPRTDKPVPNQFMIYFDDKVLFQSYQTPIALVTADGKLVVGPDAERSKTTKKYLGRFKNLCHYNSIVGVDDLEEYL